MKTIRIDVNYHTNWGQNLYISELDRWDKLLPMSHLGNSVWSATLHVPKSTRDISFKLFMLEESSIVDQESTPHHIINIPDSDCHIICNWRIENHQPYFSTSLFTNSIFKHEYEKIKCQSEKAIQIIASCIHVEDSQELVICGNNNRFGNWLPEQALTLNPISYGRWMISLPTNSFSEYTEFKLAIRDKQTKQIIEWEEGANRVWEPFIPDIAQIIELDYKIGQISWRSSGVAVPIFALRSEKSYGIGEFSDLKLLIDWGKKAKMRIIQILPINDTTATYSWLDSYPYNAISIYALHPIYLGLDEYPLKNNSRRYTYAKAAKELNSLPKIDYDKVIKLKTEYVKELFAEIGEETLKSDAYSLFYEENKEWLFPYACFCYLRDKNNSTRIQDWGDYSVYNESKLRSHLYHNNGAKSAINCTFLTQFLLHTQLTEAKKYAYKNGMALKGDIPIGVSPNSVEAWTEPHLFNLDTQTGAPPDDFSINGQNWGFPTYNWKEMKKDNYLWWTKRFIKMDDYFDAYRIDHILGFFRIWEIPDTSIFGLLGYFSPALPLSIREIESCGISYNEDMTLASIHREDIYKLFGEYSEEVIHDYLINKGDYFILKQEVDNQIKIRACFQGKDDIKSLAIREGLYQLCNEVLFIRDKYQTDRLHPRVYLNQSLRYNRLAEDEKGKFHNLHQDYFFYRHTQFWGEEAMSKLPTLIHSTDMLVCGEDLGMVPASVPVVMKELQILSLEIQRMPKELGLRFSNLSTLPYLSVSTTSTHDMSPIRMWWKENRDTTQYYYSHILRMSGEAPEECSSAICKEIIKKHQASPAMLAIHPLQDWMAMDEKLRRNNPNEERINVPSEPRHNWNYRMHITLEQLNKEKDFSDMVCNLNKESGR